MYFGKIKNGENEWGFDVFTETFESYKEISDDEHSRIIELANTEQKRISGDENGDPILTDYPAPTEEELNEREINELQSYLIATDWYAIRFADTGAPIPEEIKQRRANARLRISELRN